MEWSNEKVLEFIEIIKANKLIYDATHVDYKNNIKKKDAFGEIGALFGCEGAEAERKWKILRGQFRREKAKEDSKKKSASGIGDMHTSRWFAYSEMAFIKDQAKPNETVCKEGIKKQLSRFQSTEQLDLNIKETPTSSVNKRKCNEDPRVDAAFKVLESVQNRRKKDEFDMFGESVAVKLRKIADPIEAMQTQQKIDNILYDILLKPSSSSSTPLLEECSASRKRKYMCSGCRKDFNHAIALEQHIMTCKGNPAVSVQIEAQEDILKDAVHCTQYIKEELGVLDAPLDETMSPRNISALPKVETINSPVESTEVYFDELIPVDKEDMKSIALGLATHHESSSLNNLAIKAKILSGEYKVTNKRGGSRVWNFFGKIEDQNGEDLSNMVACRSCGNIYQHNENTTSNLERHRCYVAALEADNDGAPSIAVGVEDKKKCVRVVTQWVIENCRPFEIVDDSGLRKVAQHLISIGAKYGRQTQIETILPHPSTIVGNVEKFYDVYFHQLKEDIGSIKNVGFGLTSELWTDNYLQTSYLVLTIHFLKSGRLLSKLLALESMEGVICTNEDIHNRIQKILGDFGCDLNNKVVMVIVEGSSMVAAVSSFQHIFCVNNLIRNALQKSVEEVSHLKELCHLWSKLTKYIRTSDSSFVLKSALNSYESNRWNGLFHTLLFIQKNWKNISQILQERNEFARLKDVDQKDLKAIVEILEPFEEAFKELGRQNQPTLHLAIAHVNRLKKQCIEYPSDQRVIHDFKAKLALNLESIVLKNLTVYHKIALFLFPPANKLNQFDAQEKLNIKEKCKRIMRIFQGEVHQSEDGKRSTPGLSSRNLELLSEFIQLPELLHPEAKLNNEILAYENTNVMFYDDFSILQWWDLNKNEFPLLYKVSCMLLATPASSAASESFFSQARNIISERSSLITANENALRQILFLHANTRKTDIDQEIIKELFA